MQYKVTSTLSLSDAANFHIQDVLKENLPYHSQFEHLQFPTLPTETLCAQSFGPECNQTLYYPQVKVVLTVDTEAPLESEQNPFGADLYAPVQKENIKDVTFHFDGDILHDPISVAMGPKKYTGSFVAADRFRALNTLRDAILRATPEVSSQLDFLNPDTVQMVRAVYSADTPLTHNAFPDKCSQTMRGIMKLLTDELSIEYAPEFVPMYHQVLRALENQTEEKMATHSMTRRVVDAFYAVLSDAKTRVEPGMKMTQHTAAAFEQLTAVLRSTPEDLEKGSRIFLVDRRNALIPVEQPTSLEQPLEAFSSYNEMVFWMRREQRAMDVRNIGNNDYFVVYNCIGPELNKLSLALTDVAPQSMSVHFTGDAVFMSQIHDAYDAIAIQKQQRAFADELHKFADDRGLNILDIRDYDGLHTVFGAGGLAASSFQADTRHGQAFEDVKRVLLGKDADWASVSIAAEAQKRYENVERTHLKRGDTPDEASLTAMIAAVKLVYTNLPELHVLTPLMADALQRAVIHEDISQLLNEYEPRDSEPVFDDSER